MSKHFVIGFTILLSLSCDKTVEKKELPSYFCRPELETFFGGADSLPVITFSPSDSFGSIKSSLLKHFDSNSLFVSIRIPISIDNSKKIVFLKTEYQNPFAHIPIVCYTRHNILRIYLDNNSITINDENKIPHDSLRKLIAADILNYGRNMYLSDNPNKMVVILKWDIQIKKEIFNLALKSIIDGYIEALNIASSRYFNKHLCSITKNDFDKLISSFRFSLHPHFPEIEDDNLIFSFDEIANR